MIYLPIFIPSVCVGALLSLAFLAYSCWTVFNWCPRRVAARAQSTEDAKRVIDQRTGDKNRVHSFGWQNLQVTLRGGGRQVVLHASYGRASSRELTAIIGPSGVLRWGSVDFPTYRP